VKQNHERARGQGRIPADRLGHSLSIMAEVSTRHTGLAYFVLADWSKQAERRALDAKQEYEHCSKLIKTEVARFEQERIEDFKDSLHTFLEGMIARQKDVSVEDIF
jgi:sorting nexin-1/2